MKIKYLFICFLFILMPDSKAEEKTYSKPCACMKIGVMGESEKECVFPFLSSLNFNFKNQLKVGDGIAVYNKDERVFSYFYKNSNSVFLPDDYNFPDAESADFAFLFGDSFRIINVHSFRQYFYLSGEFILSENEKEFFSTTPEYPVITGISLNAAKDAIELTIDSGDIQNGKLQVFYQDFDENFTVGGGSWKVMKSDIEISEDDIICEDCNLESLILRVYLVSKQVDENYNDIADAEEILTDSADFADNSGDSVNSSNESVPPLPDGQPSENGFHRADTNENWQIEVSEVNRVIELYNSNRFYKLDESQIDGYAPENEYTNRITSNFHTSDSNGDGRIDMREVMHTIHLYNNGLYYTKSDDEFVPAAMDPNDTDGDGMLDSWEITHFGNLNRDANGDADGDGVSNLQEFLDKTNPNAVNAKISFAAATTSVTENAGTVDITISLTQSEAHQVTALFSIDDMTAERDVDFTVTAPQTVIFAPGETTKQIPVTIIDDGTTGEAIEHVRFALSLQQGANLGQNSMHTVYITEGGGADTDSDGLPDWWEMKYFANLSQAATGDPDADTADNLKEYLLGRHPNAGVSPDTDNELKFKAFVPNR